VQAAWPKVRIESVQDPGLARLAAGEELPLAADVQLGGLGPGDVLVEAYYGKLHGEHALPSGETAPLRCAGELGGGRYRFEGAIPAKGSGEHAFAVRVIPSSEALAHRFAMHLVAWH
jgi:starch phosphorylase